MAEELEIGDARVFGGRSVSGDFNGDGVEDLALTTHSMMPGSIGSVQVVLLRRTADGFVLFARRALPATTGDLLAAELDDDTRGDDELIVMDRDGFRESSVLDLKGNEVIDSPFPCQDFQAPENLRLEIGTVGVVPSDGTSEPLLVVVPRSHGRIRRHPTIVASRLTKFPPILRRNRSSHRLEAEISCRV